MFTPFSTKAPSYNQSFILLYVLNFYFRGRNTLPSLNYDLSIRLCMVGCYIMVSEQFVPVEPEEWTDYASIAYSERLSCIRSCRMTRIRALCT